ncbi:hypothetical protein ATN84_01770 [Paramesorhizobium deserti]|uniref:HTH merR-type domain-containing protein n=1 Tax=Paramesorhizobium deserti TaxID=1494590 RepID=A0A135HZB0_9HYPH|nr:MerR family transcriptional regulator [Paramesorhizobium deserti]KXF78546.1 hypothetical protein ATN84_01770 [Paramesorhizobium deserti]
MKTDYTVAQAALLVDIPESSIRGWIQRSAFEFGQRTASGRIRFSERDVRCLALMQALVAHGMPPNAAAKKAPVIVDRARDHALVAVVSLDPLRSPLLIPSDTLDLTGHAVVTIALGPLWAAIAERKKQMGN